MDSDSDSPFNYSWPAFPKMRIHRRVSRQDRFLDVLKRLKYPPTMLAATRLSAMLNGNDEVYANSMVVDESLTPHKTPKIPSSSLDGLDADSEGEGTYSRYDNSGCSAKEDSSGLLGNSGDELDSPETNPDFQIRPAGTLPFAQSKDPLTSGLRFRSYSYSSPKNFLGKPRLTRDLSIGDPGDERAFSLPEQSREKRIEEEEWDRYMTPTKPEAEKNKVSRTFSFLRSRMSSTRNKTKAKTKDTKEKVNRHQFALGTYSGVVPCLVCEKALLGKESFQCSNCNVNVHKACKDSAPACTKKFQDRYNTKHKSAVISNSSFKDVPQPVPSAMPPATSVSVGGKKDTAQSFHPLPRSVPVPTIDRRLDQTLESDGDTSGSRSRSQSDELLQTLGTPPSMDAFPIEDVVDAALWSDFSSDALEFEAESWSLVVDSNFCNKQEKDVIKRQDVIYELMQTELHHIQTLFIMSEVFRKGMKEELQMDHSTVDRIFPCLDELLESHKCFFYNLRERKQESREGNDGNFVINRIGDILVQQFSAENAEKMKHIYGEFCSHHIEAVNLFKELQHNKKFQNFIKVTNGNLQARRRGIPECILLVTQRITKYPVLVERILRYTPEGNDEHKDLCRALCLIKDMIAAVDSKVNEFERKQRLEEFVNKIENKTFTKMKNGHVFTKQDLKTKDRVLLHDGVLLWKTATGRFKDIQALLLTDVLLFLQEKDQKYIFAAVDQKPPVISLQKLIVREVANEERGMFLISASSAGPEMYEIHTNSKEERNSWMRQIHEAVQSCPEEDEGKISESDEDRRAAGARAAKAQEYQEVLSIHDQQICGYLEEKLQIFAELATLCGGSDVKLETQLLVKAESGEIPQATPLLEAALKETERLYMTLASQMDNSAWSSEDPETSHRSRACSGTGPFEEAQEIHYNSQSPEFREEDLSNADLSTLQEGSDVDLSIQEEKVELNHYLSSKNEEIFQAVQNVTRLLYSVQAAVTMQDSQIELTKVLHQDHEPSGRGYALRGSLLQEQYRHLEKHRGEVAKLQHQFQQEQQRWARECDQKEKELEEKENMIQQWERDWQNQVQLLEEKREELSEQLVEFQHNVERLQEGQRMVEKEREELCVQHKLLRQWKHVRQNSLPILFPHQKTEGVRNPQLDSFQMEDSVCLNNALAQISLNNMAAHPNSAYSDEYTDHASESAETSGNSPVDISSEPWSSLISRQQRLENFSRHSNKDACNNDLNAAHVIYCGTLLASGSQNLNTGAPQLPQPSDPMKILHNDSPNSIENGRIEENIIYL
ncbi:PREDICTED: rho guanine nucleotide exchange factor 28-like [Nanorana parkeri]|uniref:rho guanine nucleotide exchange factor 28-like n=1 Tax=Nanorana parkeri TaxID=125878 RepID=UPI0008547A10|nr:PREDICTED: rho guanine nucleotide exchange factor 28-like [Nanorana parkeri]